MAILPRRAGTCQENDKTRQERIVQRVRQVQDRTAPLIYAVLINRAHTDGLQCPPCLSATPCSRTFYSMHVHNVPNHNTPPQAKAEGT
jgi:hypothetical protein